MSFPSFEWGGRNRLHSIWAIVLVFTFQIRFIILETNMEVNDRKAALLRELSGTHLFISAYPVSSSTAVLEVYSRVNNKVHNLISIQDPPWLNERVGANGTFTYHGFHINICEYLAEALNLT